MAKLARFSLGRVLLHLIAMLGDRALRFHCAGILRELHWLTAATALLNRIGIRFVGALVGYLAKPIKHCEPSSTADLHSLSAVLRHCDVLLAEGNTRLAQLVKRITRSDQAGGRDASSTDHTLITPPDFERALAFETCEQRKSTKSR